MITVTIPAGLVGLTTVFTDRSAAGLPTVNVRYLGQLGGTTAVLGLVSQGAPQPLSWIAYTALLAIGLCLAYRVCRNTLKAGPVDDQVRENRLVALKRDLDRPVQIVLPKEHKIKRIEEQPGD